MNRQNATLLILVILIGSLPLVFLAGAEFGGSDDKAMQVIGELRPDYQPWVNSVWEPSGETESLMFALQAAIGAGFIGYFFGYLRGKKAARENQPIS